jgi:hypothetical protein
MPNLENLERQPFTKNSHQNLLHVRREDIFHRKDLRDGFGYSLFGIAVTLAVVGGIYVIGKQLLK